EPASVSCAGGACKIPACAFRTGRVAQLRRNAAAQRRNASAHAAKHYGSARRPRADRSDSRTDAGRYGAEDVSITIATGTRLQSEDSEYNAEHDSGARYGGADQLREPALL